MFGADKNNPRLSMAIAEAEQGIADAKSEPPSSSSARYKTSGAPQFFALAGVVIGFVLLIFPGIVALRSYRRWEEGDTATPRAAWGVLSFGAGLGTGVALSRFAALGSVAAGLIVFFAGLALSSP
jgi:hypothetical protein